MKVRKEAAATEATEVTEAPKARKTSRKRKIAYGVLGVVVLTNLMHGCGGDDAETTAPAPEPTQTAAAYPRAELTVEEVAEIVDAPDPDDTAHVDTVLDAAAVTGKEGERYIAIKFIDTVGDEEIGVWREAPGGGSMVASNAEAEVHSLFPPARDVIGRAAVDGKAERAAEDAMDGTFDAAAVAPTVERLEAEEDARVAKADAELEQAAHDAAVEDLAETFRMIDEAAAKAAEEAGN